MKRYDLVYKSKIVFTYERIENNYTVCIELQQKKTDAYKGIQIMCFEKGLNNDGFNNSVGLRRNDLLRLPLMMLHFRIYQLLGGDRE